MSSYQNDSTLSRRFRLVQASWHRFCRRTGWLSPKSWWLWHGRHVYLVDGTTVSMPDTEANQDEYPQNVAQKPGLGFPIVRLAVLLSLATAMVHDMACRRAN